MKKTLTVLLALGSAAAAEVVIPESNGFGWDTETKQPTTTYYVVGPATEGEGGYNPFVYEVSTQFDNDGTQDGRITGAVHVGSKTETDKYGVIQLDETINYAQSFDVGSTGTLVFVGETNGTTSTVTGGNVTAESFLTTTTGSGNLVLRTPDQDSDASALTSNALEVNLTDKTQFTGNLLISPAPTDGNSLFQQSRVTLKLDAGADVSSFQSVLIGSSKTAIDVNGVVGNTTAGSHIRNLTLLGSSDAYLNLNTPDNAEFVLGGVTNIEPHQYTGSGECGSTLNVDFNATTKLSIEKLSGGNFIGNELHLLNGFQSQNNPDITTTDVVATFDIKSFDFDGYISLDSYVSGGTIQGRINLERDDSQSIHQKLYDYQLRGYTAENVTNVTQKVELDGKGTYVLSEGISIKPRSVGFTYNFATLADTWQGTVEVNCLESEIDMQDYGNADSYVHFKGFKGALEGNGNVAIDTNLKLENVTGWSAYELNGTPDNAAQTQTYSGTVSGTGDFVINTESDLDVEFSGNLSDWEGDLLVKSGTHDVTFSGSAQDIKADVKNVDTGKLNLNVAANHTATFNGVVEVNRLSSTGTTVVGTADKIKAGMVSVADRAPGTDATISEGTIITQNTISNGNIANAEISLGAAAASISGVQLANTVVTGVTGNTVSLSDVRTDAVFYNNVILNGEGVTYSAVDTTSAFAMDGGTSGALSGMTLDSLSKATVKLQDIAATNLPTNGTKIDSLTVTLTGFVMEGLLTAPDSVTYYGDADTGAKVYTSTGAWHDDLVLSNNLLRNLDLTDATVTYFQMYSTDSTHGEGGNSLVITIRNATYSIPEPTTATLSLLALAGLAARRRRR